MIKLRLFAAVFGFLFLMSSCDENRVYEKNIDFTAYQWDYEDKKTFDVEIVDTELKTVFVNFRHTHFFATKNVILFFIICFLVNFKILSH